MALWGNRDSKSATGTIAIADTGVVTGSSTLFTTEADIGNYIRAGGVDYQIVTITSNTVCKVESGINGGAIAVVSGGTSYTLSEKPAFVAASESSGSPSGKHGNSNKVFGVDRYESFDSAGRVVEVGVATGGTQYAEAPTVSFSGGGGSGAAATATISGGVVTAITMTNVGGSYETVPAVAITRPTTSYAGTAFATTDTVTYAGSAHLLNTGNAVIYAAVSGNNPWGDAITFAAADINATTNVITSAAHPYITGDYVRFSDGGGTTPTGLSNNGFYYVVKTGANTFTLSDTYAHAIAGTDIIDITNVGVGTGFTLTYHFNSNPTLYVIKTGATTLKLARTAALATAGTAIDITYAGTGTTHTLTLTTGAATAVANVGGGTDAGESPTGIAHSGWVRRTTGTGGRAGRVQYETLVAMGSITGDQADDMQFQDD